MNFITVPNMGVRRQAFKDSPEGNSFALGAVPATGDEDILSDCQQVPQRLPGSVFAQNRSQNLSGNQMIDPSLPTPNPLPLR